MNWGQVILLGICPVTNDRENHQASMLSRLKAQNTWWFSLTDRDVDETSEDKFHSLLGNSHQIRILWPKDHLHPICSWHASDRKSWDNTILPNPQAFQYPTMKYLFHPAFCLDSRPWRMIHLDLPSTEMGQARPRLGWWREQRAKCRSSWRPVDAVISSSPNYQVPKLLGWTFCWGKKPTARYVYYKHLAYGIESWNSWDSWLGRGKWNFLRSSQALPPSDSIQWHLTAAQFCHSVGNHDDTSSFRHCRGGGDFQSNLWKICILSQGWIEMDSVSQLTSLPRLNVASPVTGAHGTCQKLAQELDGWTCKKPRESEVFFPRNLDRNLSFPETTHALIWKWNACDLKSCTVWKS